jgi:hypothetical protein
MNVEIEFTKSAATHSALSDDRRTLWRCRVRRVDRRERSRDGELALLMLQFLWWLFAVQFESDENKKRPRIVVVVVVLIEYQAAA